MSTETTFSPRSMAEHFRKGAAGQVSVKPLSIEETGGIPTGIAPDIKKQIASRQKRAPLSDSPAQADAPGDEVVAIVAVVTTDDTAPDDQEAPVRRAPDNLA